MFLLYLYLIINNRCELIIIYCCEVSSSVQYRHSFASINTRIISIGKSTPTISRKWPVQNNNSPNWNWRISYPEGRGESMIVQDMIQTLLTMPPGDCMILRKCSSSFGLMERQLRLNSDCSLSGLFTHLEWA